MDSASLFCHVCGAANQADAASCFACGESFSTSSPAGGNQIEELLHQRYHIINLIGTGGYAAVYRAWDIQSGHRLVAIKQINLQGITAKEAIEATDTFNREVALLSGLTHPNLPRVLDHFTDPRHWYLVMDYIEGETLEEYLQKTSSGKLPLERVLNIGLQLCTVLDYLHTRQPPIIFRDVKPANIMQTLAGHLYLIDFGTARHLKPGQEKDTIALGSPGYAAPEQYGKSQSTQQADIYSLGATLHHLLTGDDPAEDSFRFASLQSTDPSLPAALESLIGQMLDLDPGKRPTSIAVVKEALLRIAVRQSSALYETSLTPYYTASSPQFTNITSVTSVTNVTNVTTANQAMPPRSFMSNIASNIKRYLTTGLLLMLVVSIIGGSCTFALNYIPRSYYDGGPPFIVSRPHASFNEQVFRSPIIGTANNLLLDPARATDTQSIQVVSMIYTGLVSLDANLNVRPQLASYYEVSPDQLTWTFRLRLRPALLFSDGTPLTAHDVAYSIDRALQPATNAAHCLTYLGIIKYADQLHAGRIPTLINQSLLVPDDNTLIIQLSKPAPYFLSALAYPCSYVIEQHLIELNGDQNFTSRLAAGNGAGPFTVAEYYPNRQLDLVPNPNYAGPHPQLKNVIFQFYKDIATSYQAYQAGQLDTTAVPREFMLQARVSSEFHSIFQLTTHYYTMNYLVKPFDNRHIRQAFASALNRDLIVQAVWNNTLFSTCHILPKSNCATPPVRIPYNTLFSTCHILPKGMMGYNQNLSCDAGTNASAQTDNARALLQQGLREEGWSTIAQMPPITFTYASASPSLDNEATAAQQMWQTVLGIHVLLHPVSASALQRAIAAATNNPRGLQFWASNWSADYPDPRDLMSLQFAKGALHNNMNYGQNSSSNAAQQQAIQGQLEITDSISVPAARIQSYDTAELQLLNDAAWIPIYQFQTNFMLRSYVANWQTNAVSLSPPDGWSNTYIAAH
jgi:oligopeptide transport system substrate-binding protein